MLAVVFPGQGSQAPGMGLALYEAGGAAKGVFEAVTGALGFDAARLCFESSEDVLRQTQNAQVALYTVGLAAFAALKEAAPDLPVKGAAGHSVGEYAALAAAEVFSVAEGARLVRTRGETMARAGVSRPGTMAAVLGLERSAVETVCASVEGVCVVANDNCPGQLVISGEVGAVAEAGEALKAAGAKRVLPLNVSGAFHSPLMEESAKEMGDSLARAKFADGQVPVYSNVTAVPGADWPNLLEEQLKSPVRWRETLQNMARDGFDAFIECGHGSVLTGLLKRIAPEAVGIAASDPASVQVAIEAVKERHA
jgi:[acyl-carrier-protein] S-malonyltransferase